MSNPNISPKNAREYSSELKQLMPTVEMYSDIQSKQNDIMEIKTLADNDEELKKLAEEEIDTYEIEISELQSNLLDRIIPKDEDDIHNAILEIAAAAGGREASLFASEIFSMYEKFASLQRWQFGVVSRVENSEGGLSKAVASIVGKNVFRKLKYEIGVHRVQRVPATEMVGRLHTSTITVMVFPRPSDINVVLNMKDVKIDTFKSSGAGGQSVNTTDSAVRITHMPTGVAVSSQIERSQHQNRARCLEMLSAKLYDIERTRNQRAQSDAWKSQAGTGDRSERIRTYNFPQNRVTDHRISESVYSISGFLSAGPAFLEINDKLEAHGKINALLSITEQ